MAGEAVVNAGFLSSISWAYPWILILFPLPWLLRRVLPPVRQTRPMAYIPFVTEWDVDNRDASTRDASLFRLILLGMVWLLLLAAAARPAWYGKPVSLAVSGRDLMLAVDISGSMGLKDFGLNGHPVDRLTAIKAVADTFIDKRVGDRVGLILFGTHAYVQVPLTFDRKTVKTLLNEAVVGLAGRATAIGDAIALAVKRMQETHRNASEPANDRVLILLTDGVNTAGNISPEQATDLAVEQGLKIYTIGIGADSMVLHSFLGGQRVNPSADLDVKELTSIAERTGGRFFRAHDTRELKKIYHIIDQLEPVARGHEIFRPRHALFMWPLGLSLLLAATLLASMLDWRNVWKH